MLEKYSYNYYCTPFSLLEMDRKLLIKGVTHCFLPGCHLVPLPFMNYCSKTHAEIGGESGLLRKFHITVVEP